MTCKWNSDFHPEHQENQAAFSKVLVLSEICHRDNPKSHVAFSYQLKMNFGKFPVNGKQPQFLKKFSRCLLFLLDITSSYCHCKSWSNFHAALCILLFLSFTPMSTDICFKETHCFLLPKTDQSFTFWQIQVLSMSRELYGKVDHIQDRKSVV